MSQLKNWNILNCFSNDIAKQRKKKNFTSFFAFEISVVKNRKKVHKSNIQDLTWGASEEIFKTISNSIARA